MVSIQDRFGANASVDNSNPSDPVLQIKFSDLVSTGWDNLQPGDENNADKWMTALIVFNGNLEGTLTDQTHKVTVVPPLNPSLQNRNNTLFRSYGYTVTPFVPDTGGAFPDPDEV